MCTPQSQTQYVVTDEVCDTGACSLSTTEKYPDEHDVVLALGVKYETNVSGAHERA
jgi:hypothetical protein